MGFNMQAFFSGLQTFAQDGTKLVYIAALAIGILLGLMAALDIVGKGREGSYGSEKGWGAIGFRLLAASCLVTLAQKMDMVSATNGDVSGMRDVLAYARGATTGNGSAIAAIVWPAISTWVVLLGTAGFMRGFLLFDKASQGGQDSGDTAWRGLWHVVGGALAVNLFI